MFKQIIGDKLTNINTASSKLANQWMDKFRTSFDINDVAATTNEMNDEEFVTTSQLQQKPLKGKQQSLSIDKQASIDSVHPNGERNNDEINDEAVDEFDNCEYRRRVFRSNGGTTNYGSPQIIKTRPQQHQQNTRSSLVRQSTDVTTTFPLKPFQRVNSQTVEIPGLNVKVVRYRIEDDLGHIDPHMYIKYNSTCTDTLNNTTSKGKLCFTLHYNEEIQSLSVTVLKAEVYLTPTSTTTTTLTDSSSQSPSFSLNSRAPDTYVKLQLYPDKKRKYQTRICRKSATPAFDETFYFNVPLQELSKKSICLTLFDFGRFSKHSFIGSVRINDIHLVKDLTSKDIEFTRNMLPFAEDDFELGELTLSLCYLPAAGRLTVTIVKAINLKAMDINGKSGKSFDLGLCRTEPHNKVNAFDCLDPYVKVTLISKGKRVKKKKTSVMKNSLNPIYNESMIFDVQQDQIEHVDMLVKVIDYDRVGSNELIGCVGIGPSFDGIGRDHYYRMLENPRKPMTQSYYLRDGTFLRDNLPAKIEKALHADRQESMDSKGSSDQ